LESPGFAFIPLLFFSSPFPLHPSLSFFIP
jgi:hypothetical protein